MKLTTVMIFLVLIILNMNIVSPSPIEKNFRYLKESPRLREAQEKTEKFSLLKLLKTFLESVFPHKKKEKTTSPSSSQREIPYWI